MSNPLPHSGIVPIYKPVGPTSHDMIYAVRRLTGVKRVGHAGTLDPLADGVLVVAISREYTKQLAQFVQAEKEYQAEFTLGVTSTTDDAQGELTSHSPEIKDNSLNLSSHIEGKSPDSSPLARPASLAGRGRLGGGSIPNLDTINHALTQFIGTIWQVPPAFSAVKIKGKKAYELARKHGTDHQALQSLEPRKREVKAITILDYAWPKLQLKIVTGKGVYIRALARDLGVSLGTGAYMSALTRTRVGQFRLEDCLRLN